MFQGAVLTAGALVVLYLIFTLHQLLGAQSLLEAAQQQRILNQRYAKEILLSASGVPVNFEKTAKEWAQTLDVLTKGGKVRIADGDKPRRVHPPLNPARFKASLTLMTNLHQRVIQESAAYLQSARQDQHRQQLFDELYRQSLELQAAGDALVSAYDKHLDSGVSWWDVNAVAVELAERQRMLIQQHVKEVLFVAHGVPADYQATRLRLFETAKILMEGGNISVDNREAIAVPAPASEDIRFNIEQQKNAIDKFTAVSNQYLMLSNEDVERSIQLKKILDSTGEFHTAATALLTEYRSFFESRVHGAARDAALAGIFAALFTLVCGWIFLRKYVDIPVEAMTTALRTLRTSGKLPNGSTAEQSGPIGEMVPELEKCLQQWQSRKSWFDQFLTADRAEEIQDPGASDPIASRVYQWYKTRDAQSARPRWQDDEKANPNDITIVGRLPDSEPIIQDSELLDQLIQRADALHAQHEQLSRVHAQLLAEAAELRTTKARMQESEAGLASENQTLRDDNQRLRMQISEQLAEIGQMTVKTDGLIRSEELIAAGTDEIRRVNAELLISLDRQSDELRTLRAQLQSKTRELEITIKNFDRSNADYQLKISDLTQKIADAEKRQARLEADLAEREEAHTRSEVAAAKRLQVAMAENALVIKSSAEMRAQLEMLQAEADEMRQNAERDRVRVASLTALLEDAERGLTELRTTLEHLSDTARSDAETRRAMEHRMVSMEDARIQIEETVAAQLRTIHERETIITALQESLKRQTDVLESVRTEYASAVAFHSLELNRERVMAQAEMAGVQSKLDGALTRLNESQTQLSSSQSRLIEMESRLEAREADLWRIRRELVDRQHELADARKEIERLRSVESHQASELTEMRLESVRLQDVIESKIKSQNELEERRQALEQKIFLTETEYLETRRRLESELLASREAYQLKCQALALTEERLSATRTALKSALEELQDNTRR